MGASECRQRTRGAPRRRSRTRGGSIAVARRDRQPDLEPIELAVRVDKIAAKLGVTRIGEVVDVPDRGTLEAALREQSQSVLLGSDRHRNRTATSTTRGR
jgi:hypothetical protein